MAQGASDGRVRDAVVLAAGASSRMGRSKSLLDVNGISLIQLHIAAFQAAGLRPHVVLGADAEPLSAALPQGVSRFVNPHWAVSGSSDSAWVALATLGPAIVTPVDVPPASVADILRLVDAPGSAVLCFGGLDGHPVRLDPPHTHERLDVRLRNALRIEVNDPDRLLDLNTPEAWNAWITAR